MTTLRRLSLAALATGAALVALVAGAWAVQGFGDEDYGRNEDAPKNPYGGGPLIYDYTAHSDLYGVSRDGRMWIRETTGGAAS